MRIIHELYAPDIAMLPIGDHYTMGPREAGYAVNLLKPKTVIPMHFGTFPVLTGTPERIAEIGAGCGSRRPEARSDNFLNNDHVGAAASAVRRAKHRELNSGEPFCPKKATPE